MNKKVLLAGLLIPLGMSAVTEARGTCSLASADGIDVEQGQYVTPLNTDRKTLAGSSASRADEACYPINFAGDAKLERTDRYLNSITFRGADGTATTLQVGQGATRALYIKCLDKAFTAKAGEKVTVQFNWSGTWMNGYVFLDTGNDGEFNVATTGEGANITITDDTDLMAYSNLEGKNSAGQTLSSQDVLNPPTFTVPADLKPGVYRLRFKVDWSSVDPGGNTASGNDIIKNGGVIVDTRLIVHTDNVTLKLGTPSGDGLNGKVLKADGSEIVKEEIPFGQPYTVKLQPTEGYKFSHLIIRHGNLSAADSLVYETPQYVNNVVYPFSLDGEGCYTIPAGYVDGDVELVPCFGRYTGNADEAEYKINVPEDLEITRTDRRLNSLKLTAADGAAKTITLKADAPNTVYRNMTAAEMLVKAGQQISSAVNYTGGPMHGYLYIDYNNDGHFDALLDNEGIPTLSSELVAFSYYNGKNSLGEACNETEAGVTPPTFTIPAELPVGVYRARFKVDWNNADPAGQWKENAADGDHMMDAEGGYIIDFLMNVHQGEGRLQVLTRNGSIVGSGNTGLGETVTVGKALPVMFVPAATGYVADVVTIRHGHHIDGPQYVHGNRQWSEYQKPVRTMSIPKDSVNGDMRLTVNFEPTENAEYKLQFADEFDQPDGTMPDDTKWTRCDVGHGITWKRFVAQTKEGQKQTGYIEDGMLVMLCKPNTLAGEKDNNGVKQQMISGAVESYRKFDFTYGKVEGRLKTNPFSGNFPAFWMMPTETPKGWPKDGEIDIWEQIDTQNTAYQTIHSQWANEEGGAGNPQKGGTCATDANQFHVYGLEWTEDKLTWYVDGKSVFSYAKSTDANALAKGQWPFNKHFYLILNQSVGNGSWAKPADTSHTYKTVFDWVRVYQKDGQINTAVNEAAGEADKLDYYVRPGKVLAAAVHDTMLRIVDLQGRTVYNRMVQGNVTVSLQKGVYVLNGQKILVP